MRSEVTFYITRISSICEIGPQQRRWVLRQSTVKVYAYADLSHEAPIDMISHLLSKRHGLPMPTVDKKSASFILADTKPPLLSCLSTPCKRTPSYSWLTDNVDTPPMTVSVVTTQSSSRNVICSTTHLLTLSTIYRLCSQDGLQMKCICILFQITTYFHGLPCLFYSQATSARSASQNTHFKSGMESLSQRWGRLHDQ